MNEKDFESWYLRGVNLDESGEHEKAIEAFDEALKINPKSEMANYGKGFALGESGRDEEAIEAFDKVLEINSTSELAWLNLGLSFARLEKYEEALEAFDKVLEIKPDSDTTWLLKGRIYSRLEKYEETLEAFDKVLETNPEHAESWMERGFALAKSHKYVEAVLSYDKALKIEPELSTTWVYKGYALLELKEYSKAIEAFKKALKINPELPVWAIIGDVLYEMQDYSEAMNSFEKALKINPKDSKALAGKERSSLQLKNNCHSSTPIENKEEKLPIEIKSLLEEAQTFFDNYDYKKAFDILLKARNISQKLNNDLATAEVNLMQASIYTRTKKDPIKARILLEGCLAIFENNNNNKMIAHSYYLLSITYIDKEQYETAQATLKQSLDIYSELKDEEGRAKCLHQLGWVSDLIGEYKKALKYYEKSLSICLLMNSRSEKKIFGIGHCYYHIGLTHGKLGNSFEAESNILKSIEWFEKDDDKIGIALAKHMLARHKFNEGKVEESFKLIQNSVELYSSIGDHENVLKGLSYVSQMQYSCGNIDTAKGIIMLILDYAYKNKLDSNNVGYNFIKTGKLFLQNARVDMANTYFNAAKDFFNNKGYVIGYADALLAIADMEYSLNNFEKATALRKEIKNIFESELNKSATKKKMGMMVARIGSIHEDLKEYHEALNYYTKAKKIFEESNDIYHLANILGNIIICNQHLGDRKDEEKTLRYIIKLAEGTSFYEIIAGATSDLADIENNKGNLETAAKLHEKACFLAIKHNLSKKAMILAARDTMKEPNKGEKLTIELNFSSVESERKYSVGDKQDLDLNDLKENYRILEEIINRKGRIPWIISYLASGKSTINKKPAGPMQKAASDFTKYFAKSFYSGLILEKDNEEVFWGKFPVRYWRLNEKDFKFESNIHEAVNILGNTPSVNNFQEAFGKYPDSVLVNSTLVDFISQNKNLASEKDVKKILNDCYGFFYRRKNKLSHLLYMIEKWNEELLKEDSYKEYRKYIKNIASSYTGTVAGNDEYRCCCEAVLYSGELRDELDYIENKFKLISELLPEKAGEDADFHSFIEELKGHRDNNFNMVGNFFARSEFFRAQAYAAKCVVNKMYWKKPSRDFIKELACDSFGLLVNVLTECDLNYKNADDFAKSVGKKLSIPLWKQHLQDAFGIPKEQVSDVVYFYQKVLGILKQKDSDSRENYRRIIAECDLSEEKAWQLAQNIEKIRTIISTVHFESCPANIL